MTSQPPGNGIAFIEDAFVPIADARIPILDLGFLHSDATYDVAHVWQGRFFRLDDHLDRFEAGMRKLRLSLPYDRAQIREVAIECVRRSGLRDAYVEIICTRGVPDRATRDPRDVVNRFYAFAIPFVWIADPNAQTRGLHLTVSKIERISPRSVDPTVKNYHWLDLVMGLFAAYDRGGETAVLVDSDRNVCEGAGFNLFVVREGTLATPASGVLEGITRRTVLEVASSLALKADQRPVSIEELSRAEEVFATSTAGGVMPVTIVDGAPVGNGTPGEITSAIRDAYWKLHRDSKYSFPVAYEPD